MSNFDFVSQSIAAFEISGVKKLVAAVDAHRASGGTFSATMDMLFDGANFKGGKPLDSQGKPESESEMQHFWPSANHMLPEKLVPAMQIVGDHGVYLLTNMVQSEPPSKSGMICYAEGCSPDKDDDFYENKEFLFGGDDGSVQFPLEWARWAIKNNKAYLKIKMSNNCISLIQTD